MRLIHTADWHLGRSFHGVSLLEDQAAILEQFKHVVAEEKPDAIIVAGDIYDRSLPPSDAVRLLNDTLEELVLGLKVPVLMIAGNHDSAERLGFASSMLEAQGLYLRGRADQDLKPVTLSDKHGDVEFCLIPYELGEPIVARSIFKESNVQSFDDAMARACRVALSHTDTNKRRVCIAHCFAIGGSVSDSERPLNVGGSDAVKTQHFAPFNYVALGHLHRPQTVADNGAYSGSLLKYSFSEANHTKSITIVDIDEDGKIERREVSLSVKRDVRIVEGEFDQLLNSSPTNGKNDYILARLSDLGALYDPLARLRQVYPNILQIERTALFDSDGKGNAATRDTLKRNDLDLFASFYQDITDRPLTDDAISVIKETIDQLNVNDETTST